MCRVPMKLVIFTIDKPIFQQLEYSTDYRNIDGTIEPLNFNAFSLINRIILLNLESSNQCLSLYREIVCLIEDL